MEDCCAAIDAENENWEEETDLRQPRLPGPSALFHTRTAPVPGPCNLHVNNHSDGCDGWRMILWGHLITSPLVITFSETL